MKFNSLKTKAKSNFNPQKQINAKIGNVNKLLRMTSHDIYSHPLRTGIQEYLSNAKDAHTESGVCLSKMIIEAPTLANQVIRIRDFGKGLSEEYVAEYYLSFASSTKDTSNESIGGFGLGSKSWFAVNDAFSMISIHKGIKTVYQIEKDPVHYCRGDIMFQEETDEPSGIELLLPIKNKKQIMEAKNYINRVIKYWDKKPQVKNMTIEELETEIKNEDYSLYGLTGETLGSYENASDKRCNVLMTLGGIEYGVDQLSNFQEIRKILVGLDVCMHFNVGEIEISPNRETITNNEETCALVLARAEKIFEEVKEFYLKNLKKKTLSYIVKNQNNVFLSRILDKNRIKKGIFSYKFERSYYSRGSSYTIYKNNCEEPFKLTDSSTMFVLKNNKLTKADNIVDKINLIDKIVVNDEPELKMKDLRFSIEKIATNNEIVGNSRGSRYTGLALVPNGWLSEKMLKDLQPQHKVYNLSEIKKICTKERQSHEKKILDTTEISVYFSASQRGRTFRKYVSLDKKTCRISTVSDYNGNEEFKNLLQSDFIHGWSKLSGIEYLVVSKDYFNFLQEKGFKEFTKSSIQKEIVSMLKKYDFSKTHAMSNFLEKYFTRLSYSSWDNSGPKDIETRMDASRENLQICEEQGLTHTVFEQIKNVLNQDYKGLDFENSDKLNDLMKELEESKFLSDNLKELNKFLEKSCKKVEKELKLVNMKNFFDKNPLLHRILRENIINDSVCQLETQEELNEVKRMLRVSEEDYQ